MLAPGGTLLLTLDNPLPTRSSRCATASRGSCTGSGSSRTRSASTCGPRRLRTLVEDAGLDVEDEGALMHVPRVLALLWLQLRGGVPRLVACEALERLPTRYLTGQFVTIKARKP